MESSINFKLNTRVCEVNVSADNLDLKLVDYIRVTAGLTGTKTMCREGGCGACVVSARFGENTGIRAINSCLVPLRHCDGWDITTVEGLGNRQIGYSPLEKELVSSGGVQCGFCTPGMLMSAYCFLQQKADPKIGIESCLDGQICRCTGYRSIVDAFRSSSTQCHGVATDIEDIPLSCEKKTPPVNLNSFPIKLDIKRGDWLRPKTISEVLVCFGVVDPEFDFRIVAGNTGEGIYKEMGVFDAVIDLGGIPELRRIQVDEGAVYLGGGITFSDAINTFNAAVNIDGYSHFKSIVDHLSRIGSLPIRNVATLAGNLMLRHKYHDFPSDLFVVVEAVGGALDVVDSTGKTLICTPDQFLALDMKYKIIKGLHLKPLRGNSAFRSFKISRRYMNAHAIINAGFMCQLDSSKARVLETPPRVIYGGINDKLIHVKSCEDYLPGKLLSDPEVIQCALDLIGNEIENGTSEGARQPMANPEIETVRKLAQGLFYKFILEILGDTPSPRMRCGALCLERGMISCSQKLVPKSGRLSRSARKLEGLAQCSGEAKFVNDRQMIPGELFGEFVLSTCANGEIESLEASEALAVPGVLKFIRAADIPGVNNYYVFSDVENPEPEEVFASSKVNYHGQPIGLILAESRDIAQKATRLVAVKYTNIMPCTVSMLKVLEAGSTEGRLSDLISNKQEYNYESNGCPEDHFRTIDGEFHVGGQYHFTMETQQCICIPTEDGLEVHSSTQAVDFVQASISNVLGIPCNTIVMSVRRVGGSYGSKGSRSAHVATAAAVGAFLANRPVRVILDLETNMQVLGKRPAYYIKYNVRVNKEGKILHLDANLWNDSGCTKNEEKPEWYISYLQNCYNVMNWTIGTGQIRTNTPPNTYCRAPGTTQAIGMIEHIMEHISFELNVDPLDVRRANLIKTGDQLIPGFNGAIEKFESQNKIPRLLNEMEMSGCLTKRKLDIQNFNHVNRWQKRGLAVVPMRYHVEYIGMSYPVFVVIYHVDGSVVVSHGGVEIGQGINTKVAQVVATKFGIPNENVRVAPLCGTISANTGATGGSVTSELCCYAASRACDILLKRMEVVQNNNKEELTWRERVQQCHQESIDLKASYMYNIKDPVKEYDIWALNCTEVEIDVLTGEHKIRRIDLVEDVGLSLNPGIDLGQVEGALVMGIGLWTSESLAHDNTTGELITKNTWKYKPPLVCDIPENFRITLLEDEPNPHGVLGSKGTGEPPLCTSVAVHFALRNAITAARKDAGNFEWFSMESSLSPLDAVRLCLTRPEDFTI